jgi:glutaredoxin 3
VVIYTSGACMYCWRALKLLESRRIPFEQRDLSGDPAGRARLADQVGRTSVPQVFLDGRAIGGFDDLRALDASGALARQLAAPPP